MNVFGGIGHFFSKLLHFVTSSEGRNKIAKMLEEAQKLIQPALDACAMIATLTPSRSDDELIALAGHYTLGVVTPDMLRNDAMVSGLLKAAAMKELQKLTGSQADPRVLDLAIQSAYLVFKQAKADMAAAAAQ